MPSFDSFYLQEHFRYFKKGILSFLLKKNHLFEGEIESYEAIDESYAIIEKKALFTSFESCTIPQRLVRAWWYFMRGDMGEAERWVEIDEHNEASLALLAEIYLKNNDLTNAIEQADAAIKEGGEYAPAYIIRAQGFERQNNLEECIKSIRSWYLMGRECFEKYIARDFYNAHLFYLEKNYQYVSTAVDLAKYSNYEYDNYKYIDDQSLAYLSGITMIADAKKKGSLKFIYTTPACMAILKKKRSIDIMACPSLTQEEKNI